MRNYVWLFVLILLAGATFFFFYKKQNDSVPPADKEEVETGDAENEKEDEVGNESEPIEIEEESNLYSINISVPGGLPNKVHDKILADLEKMIKEFKKVTDSMSDLPEFMNELWLTTEEVKEYTGEETRSIEIPVHEYTGGAHGNTVYYTYTYDSDGNILTLGEVIKNDFGKIGKIRDEATRKLLDKFNKEIDEMANSQTEEEMIDNKNFMRSMVEGGVSVVDFNYDTWVINGKDLMLIFPPYAVAPYASGTQRVGIPLSSI